MHNLISIKLIPLLLILTTIININFTTSESTETLASQFLEPQNAARAALSLPPLQWDPTLTQYAQAYANIRKNDCALQHSNGPYGENIFWGGGSGFGPAQAVDYWASERKYYNYWTNMCMWNQQCLHFTQIAWKSTTRVGCAKVTCTGAKGVFMTCNYYPRGNIIGQRPY